jgi:hypothetical protein
VGKAKLGLAGLPSIAVAKLGLAGGSSIAVVESVFWVSTEG